MTRERHERLMALFESSLDLAPPERARYLDEQCSDDPALREEVEALLSADGLQGSLLDDSPIPAVSRFLRDALTAPGEETEEEEEGPAPLPEVLGP